MMLSNRVRYVFIATIVTCAGLAGTSARCETRALLAGAWQFNSHLIPNLEGPQNDLAAMEAVIRAEGASDVTVLRNDGVTRTTFETALHALGLRARKGDWIFIYYSGHGAEADATVKGTADGDRDQFLPLPGFDLDHQDPDHFIVDKDLYAWVARYIPRSTEVLLIADTCHSGTMHRSIDPRAFRFTPRLAFRGYDGTIRLVARPAARFPSVLADQPVVTTVRPDLPNEIYIGAAQDDELALEAAMPAEGAPPRGLLSYALEQALTARGPDGRTLAADTDRDGRISVGEVAAYLDSQVRALTGQRQTPSAHYPGGADRIALFETIAVPAALPAAPPAARPLPAVFVDGMAEPGGVGWRPVARGAQADFVWDVKTGTVIRGSGDVVASGIGTVAGLNGVIEKWDVVETLRPFLAEAKTRLTIDPGSGADLHKAGTIVHVGLQAAAATGTRYATVFDLASDGTVQRLFPMASDGDGVITGRTLPVLESRVVPPFGADHVIALVTPTVPLGFRDRLRVADGQRGAGRLLGPLEAELSRAGSEGGLSAAELYTGR